MNKTNELIPTNLYDLDMERAILSSILISSGAYDSVSHIINKDDFYLGAHSDIYEACTQCVAHDEPTEGSFVKKYLGKKYNEAVFLDIVSNAAVVDVEKYATELKEKSIKRSLLDIAYKIPSKVSENIDSKDMVDDISSKIYALVEGTSGGSIKISPQIITEVMLELKKQNENKDKDIIGLDTGFAYLNEYTKGFKPGELIIIAARPGMGKTAFALNLVLKTLKQNKGVMFFSLEMPAAHLMMRLLSAHSSIPLSNILTAKMNDDELTRFSDACNQLSSSKLFVYDDSYVSIHQIRTQMRKLKGKDEEISLCVIDYIGLMTSSSNYSERHLQIAEISRGLKLLARELEIPIIALSQLNRGVEARSNKRPMLSDLRESGAIEQDADMILFVYRGDVYAEQEEKEREERARNEGTEYKPKFIPNKDSEEAEIIVGKNRNGALGNVKVIFQREFTRFVDASFISPQEVEFKE